MTAMMLTQVIVNNVNQRRRTENMSKYYELRKEAFNTVVEMHSKGASKDHIVYKIAMNYGFSTRFVTESLKAIEDIKQ